MKRPISLSIFFPAYNEEQNIEETVLRTIRVVGESPYISKYEIIIVNDGSSDKTRTVSQNLARRFDTVRVVSHQTNLGYGAALKTGIAAARMDYVFFTDADLQFDIVELQNLLVHLSSYPVVIGYRAPRRDRAMRLFNAWGWKMLNRLFFGLRVRDIDCAFKIFKREELQNIHLESGGAMISAEALIRLIRTGVPVKEVPVSHLPRVAGSPTGAKASVIVRALREMIGLYRGDLGLVTRKQTFRFMSVGVLNTALDALAYIALTRGVFFFSEHFIVAKFLSFFVGTVSSLLINRSWTFGMRERLTVAEIIRFYTIVPVAIFLNVATMNFLVGLGMYDLEALAFSASITFAFNFTLSKFWVFTEKSPEIGKSTTIPVRQS